MHTVARHRARSVNRIKLVKRAVLIAVVLIPGLTVNVAGSGLRSGLPLPSIARSPGPRLSPSGCPRRPAGRLAIDLDCGISSVIRPISWGLDSPADLAPKIFNATREAKGGDIISVQGANLDPSTVASLEGPNGASIDLPIVNRVEAVQLSLQLPKTLVDPVIIRLKNDNGVSDALRLNAPRPQHLDATRLVTGGRFRVFGRSLKVAGHEPRMTVEGQPAAISLDASTETMLVATVPQGVGPLRSADIAVDNGNGTGASHLPISVSIEKGSGDPLSLDVGWAAGFDFVKLVIPVETFCDGVTDVTEQIKTAVRKAVSAGGGVVLLPEGTCRLGGTVDLASKVVLRGAGQDRTVIVYGANYPIYAEGFDLVGLQDLQLRNAGAVQEGMVWRNNTRSVIQRVTLNMQKSRQWFLTSNRDFVFDSNTIVQTDSFNEQNPYRFDRSSGLVFSNNTSTNSAGSPTFQFVHDSVFVGNHITRDASRQDESTVVAHHQFVIDFAYRVSIIGNRFDVINGPITATLRNDGETILVEGGGPLRTEQVGTIAEASGRTLTDPNSVINVDPFKTGLPWNLAVAIVSGKGAGQTRRITGYRNSTLEVDRDWDLIPDAGSHYATFVWGLDDVLIDGNTLIDNPRGIWLYSCSVRNVFITHNTIMNGGGIYLRSFQILKQKWFNIQLNTVITDNTIENDTGRWMSYLMLENVRSDPLAFGIGNLGTEVRRNTIVANIPNVTSQTEEYASREGYVALVHSEGGAGVSGDTPATVAPIFQNNVCTNCATSFVVGTGVYGADIAENKQTAPDQKLSDDLKTFDNRAGASTSTSIR